jgi:hypothetical protein
MLLIVVIMTEITERNRECALKVLEELGYEKVSIPNSPIIGAYCDISIEEVRVLEFCVMCEYPYKEFKKWIGRGSPEINEEKVQELLDKLNSHLKECIERSSIRKKKKVEQPRWSKKVERSRRFQPKLPKSLA